MAKLLVLLCVIYVKFCDSLTPSGLYNDDGRGHTILSQKFDKLDIKEISYDLLNIMGFHHKPKPHMHMYKSPSAQFLKEVYDSLASSHDDLEVDLSNGYLNGHHKWDLGSEKNRHFGQNLSWSEFNVDQNEVDAMTQSDSIISFANRGHRYSNLLKNYEENKQFWFDVSETSDLDYVLGAELRLYKRTTTKGLRNDLGLGDGNGEVFRISVKQVSHGIGERTFEEMELDEIVTAKWDQGWLRMNVTVAFKNWILNPEQNLGLVISTKRVDSGLEVPLKETGLADILDSEEFQPFLVTFLKTPEEYVGKIRSPKGHRRVIRSTKQRRNKKTKKGRQMNYPETNPFDRPRNCQMGMLYVNFEDLGWKDWVIAPDGFIAYYCHGECSFPLTASMNATNHAIVSTLVHTYYPLEYPKPSCAPSKLGSISMLYYDDNSNVTVKRYRDIVVRHCGCK